jgi:hypothetical protein
METEGRAADEAAARRKLRACPLAYAKAAGFVKRPSEPRAFGLEEPARRDTGPSGSGPARRKAGLRSARRHRRRRASARIGRAGPGFGPGAAKWRTQDFGPWTARRNRGFGRGSRRLRDRSFGFRDREGGKRDASSKFAKRRTARASALVGEPAGKLETASAVDGLRRTRQKSPRLGCRILETAQRGTPRLPGRVLRDGPHWMVSTEGTEKGDRAGYWIPVQACRETL